MTKETENIFLRKGNSHGSYETLSDWMRCLVQKGVHELCATSEDKKQRRKQKNINKQVTNR